MWVLSCPLIIIIFVIAFLVAIAKKQWRWAICFFVCALVSNLYAKWFSISLLDDSGEKSFRILTYNVNSNANYFVNDTDSLSALISFIDSVNADVVALQEYDTKWNVRLNQELNKRYLYKSDSLVNAWGNYKALYSKFPVRNVICAPREIAPHVVFTEINVNGRWIRFVNVHLASNHYTVNLKDEDATFADYFSSVKEGYEKRKLQSKLIVDSLSKHKYALPIIIAGDFNDVGGSYTLRILESFGLQDAWWSGGTGIGITYDAHLLKLRLDHILYSKEFELKSVAVPHVKFSDHYPVVADFVLR